MKIEDFDPVSSSLNKGINLIEASAGTGKTYTIAMLVLRLVVEYDVAIDKILVVTFTKAATEELKDRIRNRLGEAKNLLSNQPKKGDINLISWLEQLAIAPEIIEQRLSRALLDIDQAAIFTIHAFCQRVLNEHALTSGQLFDAELTSDLALIKQACADDFWRHEIQYRPAWQAEVLTREFKSPEALLSSIPAVAEDTVILPDVTGLDPVLADFKTGCEIAGNNLANTVTKLLPYVESNQFKTAFLNSLFQLSDDLATGNQSVPDLTTKLDSYFLFTHDSLLNNLNGSQFRSNKNQSSEERKTGFLSDLELDFRPFDTLHQATRQVNIALKTSMLAYLRAHLDKELERLKVWSFDSLISHLHRALRDDHAGHLVNELRQRYSAALIDEFQDTDNKQWHIFSSIFAVSSHYLMLVGDPKQAIYKFRGADIYSYLAAQKRAQQQFTLRRNWRSHPDLVAGINRLFQREGVFLLPDISFNPSEAALTSADGALMGNNQAVAPLMLWQLPESESKTGFWQPNLNDAANRIAVTVVNEIVDLLTGEFKLQPQNRKLHPQDIAILVRTNKQAREYQDALRLADVPSVLTSTEAVFGTEEAINLYKLLQAAANPDDARILGQALALNWFGHNGADLYRILNHEQGLDDYLARFSAYHNLWQEKGLMTMMQTLLSEEKITTIFAETRTAERSLTNLQHVLELLQQAVIDGNLGIHKTLSLLKNEIILAEASKGGAENQQLRLESDADAVMIITMHRAKGLEFPVVFCPCLWQSGKNTNQLNQAVICHLPDPDRDGSYRTVADFGSPEYDRHMEQARFEARAEESRLAYVALTRAKFRCYVAWADSRTEKEPNATALAWLLGLGDLTFSGQQELLLELTKQQSGSFAYRLLDLSPVVHGSYRQSELTSKLHPKKRRRSLYTDWQMSSYTALSKLSLSEVPELPADKADELEVIADETSEALPAGAHTGNVIHELLETVSFADLASNQDITAIRNKACQYYNLNLSNPGIINDLLYKAVSTPLSETDHAFSLKNIPGSQCLKEMPFYLGLSSFNTREINRILQDQPVIQALSHKQMCGYLTGFIDLVCEYQGRYYVMDYKTNALSDYGPDTLLQAMREHNYGLQYWLYCIVLHRYLKHRLADYDYNRHFGGVRYLFVRGMEPAEPMSGVFHDRPDFAPIEALSTLFQA